MIFKLYIGINVNSGNTKTLKEQNLTKNIVEPKNDDLYSFGKLKRYVRATWILFSAADTIISF